MSRHITPIILIVLSIGIFFTFTKGRLNAMKEVRAVNDQYQTAIKNATQLVKVRDEVLKSYNSISEDDRARLDKMLPNNVDNVRLIIDVNNIASRHGFALKNVRTSAVSTDGSKSSSGSAGVGAGAPSVQVTSSGSVNQYNTVTLSFSVTATYDKFLDFLRDLESSLRIIDISKITLSSSDTGLYEYGVEIKTYWLKQ